MSQRPVNLRGIAQFSTPAACALAQIAGYPTVKLIHKGQPTDYSGEWTVNFVICLIGKV
jgi:hypothetical protein